MFYWRTTIETDHHDRPADAVEMGFTGRSAGRGGGAYAGLNLGGHVGDAVADVEANREALALEVDLSRERLVFMNQVHGSDVVEVDAPWDGEAPAVDGIVTRATDLALAVLVADCVPVLLHDVRAGVVGAVHAGRPGMVGGIVGRAVTAMRDLGATSLSATVGPSVCGRCYEVPGPWPTLRRRRRRRLRRAHGPGLPRSTSPPEWSNSWLRPTLRCNGSRAARGER